MATRAAAPAAATTSPARTHSPYARSHTSIGHIEMARGVGHLGEERQVGRAQQPARFRLPEEIVGLLPSAPRRGGAGALDQGPINRPFTTRPSPARCNRESYRGNGAGHASTGMKRATVNGIELEYEIMGSGEPVLLISPVLTDGFLPFLSEPALADRYRLIRYHKRGWAGSTHTPAAGEHRRSRR